MEPLPTNLRISYGFLLATAGVAATYVIRLLLGPLLGGHAPFLLFVLPVALTVIYAGARPGLLAGLLSLIAGFSFADPDTESSTAIFSQAALFILVCAGIGFIGERRAREQELAEDMRQAAEKEARRARAIGEELRLLLEGARSYAIFMVDLEGKVSTWNSGAEHIFGWTEAEIMRQHCSIFYAADNATPERIMADLVNSIDEDRASEELWQIRKDGSEFLADITVTAMRNEAGNVKGFANVIHDVTERRAAEKAIDRRERHLQSILDTVPDAMIVIDAAGIMISFSATAERLFGFREEEMVGKNVRMLMPNPDRDRHDGYISRYLETGDPHIIGIGRIVTGLRADGSTFPMKLSVGETKVDEQRLFTGFVQDLTEKQHFESRLEQMQSELVHVSRLSAMGTMASTLAHELNQPLTAIATYGEAAAGFFDGEEELDREMLKEIVGDMAAQALRAGAIVRRLREFVARGEVNKTIEDLPKLINEASALALVGSREKGIVSRFEFDPEATPVLADHVQIQQVLVNLMRNAIEAMADAPTRRLTVSTKLLDRETIEIRIADTGHGIDSSMQERLFDAFASTKDTGMGLGLSICRTIVEAHGGRISARPAEGGGTEFLFTLVRAPEPNRNA